MTEKNMLDALVVGAGPAGLSAARTLARRGFSPLVLERRSDPGVLDHPCGSVLSPVRGFVRIEVCEDGYRVPEVDLIIPPTMIVARPQETVMISPAGFRFGARRSNPAVRRFQLQVDRSALMRSMAREAESLGARIRWGCAAEGLIVENGRIVGVRTEGGDLRARVVIAAEGFSRRLAREAGLIPEDTTGELYVYGRLFKGVPLTSDEYRTEVRFGVQWAGLAGTCGVFQTQGRQSVWIMAASLAGNGRGPVLPMPEILDRWTRAVPSFYAIAAARRPAKTSACRIAFSNPVSSSAPGFFAAGACVARGGRSSILTALRQGADAGASASNELAGGNGSRFCVGSTSSGGGPLSRGEMEERVLAGALAMADRDLDRAARALSRVNLDGVFSGGGLPGALAHVAVYLRPSVLAQLPSVAKLLSAIR